MPLKSVFAVSVAGLLAGVCLSGCGGRRYESDFPVVIVNRMSEHNPGACQRKRRGHGVVSDSPPRSRWKLPESNANVFSNGTAPTPQADVTFTAKDTRTGSLSSEKSMTISQAAPTYVSFDATDFPAPGRRSRGLTFSPTNPTINQDVSFNGSSSTVSNGTFAWDFGDGQNGTGVTTTHRYTRAGTFTITMSVTSDTRATSTSSRTINVSATLPPTTASFTFSPTNPSLNQDVIFTATANDRARHSGRWCHAGTFSWDFGDGGTAIGSPVTHRYARGGTYTVTLRVTTDAGLAAATSRAITISTTLPTGSANFTFSPTDPRRRRRRVLQRVVIERHRVDRSAGTSATARTGSGVAPVHSYSTGEDVHRDADRRELDAGSRPRRQDDRCPDGGCTASATAF